MTREQYVEWLDRWLYDVRVATLRNVDKGTPMPLCLVFAQHDIYKAWARAHGETLSGVMPVTLFPRN